MSSKKRRTKPEGNRPFAGGPPGVTGEVTIPASVLGPPQNEAEAASPAFQAMRMLGEGTLRPGSPPGAPKDYELIEPGDIINPPLIGMLHGEVRADVAPPGRAVRRVEYIADDDAPGGYRIEGIPKIDPATVPVRISWTAADVLDQHTRLTERMVRPNEHKLDFIRYFVTDCYRKSPERAQGMFYPADLRPLRNSDQDDPGREVARQICGIIGHGLSEGITYQITGEMVAVMRQLLAKSPDAIAHIDEAELPAPAGFAWLDDPWPITDANGYSVPVRAMSWELEYAWSNGSQDHPLARPERVACARIGLWTLIDDDVAYGRWAGQEERASSTSASIGEVTLMHLALLPFGERFSMPPHARDIAESILGLVHMLWMFLGMEIVSTEVAHDIPRSIRKQAARSLKHGEVRVVILRKIRHAATGEVVSSRDVDWSCRWVVAGHARHIDKYDGDRHHAVRHVRAGEKHDLCGICLARGEQVRVTFVRPYIKGPDGLPLRAAGPVVNRLAR